MITNSHEHAISTLRALAEDEDLAHKLARTAAEEVSRSGFRRIICYSEEDGYFLSFDRHGLPVYEITSVPSGDWNPEDLVEWIMASATSRADRLEFGEADERF